ncbi:F-box/LRR-repeat protein 7 [Galendromus occidentalis]|uniref:F-box/LRR-repeat protein 7 n=1 Tax=Galendromus occidentalis TaxID=34638 RepID=A0AAJ7L730_9ACAR|nr:F-box/LRR-repeat protein 7 [Galendromus occidentalis]
MADLPLELLEGVFLRLGPLDRLSAARTCRRWAEIMCEPKWLEAVQFVIPGPEAKEAALAFRQSPRQYRYLSVTGGNLHTFDRGFWNAVNEKIRDLRIIQCKWSFRRLCDILGLCRDIESLQLLTEETLELLRSLMPGLASISLTSSLDTRSRAFSGALAGLLNSGQRLIELDLNLRHLSDADVIGVLRKHSESVEWLRLGGCHSLQRETYTAIGGCRKLRRLSLLGATRFDDAHLRQLSLTAPDLEHLSIGGSSSISKTGLNRIFKYGKLRRLALEHNRIVASSLTSLGNLSDLRHLYLVGVFCDARVFRDIASLKELQSLILASGAISSGCFGLMVGNLSKLEMLDVGSCEVLTDEDGIKFSRLKKLKYLRIRRAPNFTAAAFERGLGSSAMASLAFEKCSLDDDALVSIAEHHPSLTGFMVHECGKIGDQGLKNFLLHQPNLKGLTVHHCKSLTSQIVSEIEISFPRLSYTVELGIEEDCIVDVIN